MNILFLSHEYPPDTNKGGISTYTKDISVSLVKQGNKVVVLTYSFNNPRTYYDDGVKVIRLNFSFLYRLYPLFIVPYIISIVKNEQIDIIEAPEYCAEAVIYQFIKSVPIITRLHAPSIYINKADNKSMTLFKKMLNKLEYLQTVNSDCITCVSNYLLNEVKLYWPLEKQRIEIIPNGVNVERSKGDLNTRLGEEYILYFGKLKESKGVLVFTYAVKKLLKSHPKLKVVYLGQDIRYKNGTMSDYIKNVLKDYQGNILFTVAYGADKESVIINSKFVVTPSLKEGFGLTALEAMALGKVVIATRNNGFEEFITDKGNGLLTNPGDYEDLYSTMVACLSSSFRKRIESNARNKSEQYLISNISRKTIDIYKRTISQYKKNK